MAECQQHSFRRRGCLIRSGLCSKSSRSDKARLIMGEQCACGENNACSAALERITQTIDHFPRSFFRCPDISRSRSQIKMMKRRNPGSLSFAAPDIFPHNQFAENASQPKGSRVRLVLPVSPKTIPPQKWQEASSKGPQKGLTQFFHLAKDRHPLDGMARSSEVSRPLSEPAVNSFSKADYHP